MAKRSPRTKRVQQAIPEGMDLAALEDFCLSARENGAGDDALVYARVSWRGVIAKAWADIEDETTPPPPQTSRRAVPPSRTLPGT